MLKQHIFVHVFLHVFVAWLSVSADVSLNYSWISKQWHHCTSYRVPWSSDVCLRGVFCLSMCVCACSLFNKKQSHCVTTARLVPSCFRGEGKTGRSRGGMSIGRGRASLKLHTSIKGNGSKSSACCCHCHMLMKSRNQHVAENCLQQ